MAHEPTNVDLGQEPTDTKKAPRFRLLQVRSEEDLRETIALFYEYTKWLNLDLAFQNFEAEMAGMPGKYAPPTGELVLARSATGKAVGCVAVKGLSQGVCEMKRLWVKDAAKDSGVGRALVSAIIDTARVLGYKKMRLDTLSHMTAAVKMYRAFGFVEIAPYYTTPLVDTVFLELDLTTD